MKEFHFTKTYFNATVFEDKDSNVRVVVDERPSVNLSEEEYSLRVTTRFETPKFMHRNYAIEHHLPLKSMLFRTSNLNFTLKKLDSLG